MTEYRPTDSFDEIWRDAKAACAGGPRYNLLLCYEFDVKLVDSQFVKIREEKAREWQSEAPSSNLFFSHGQYFKGERGIQHVIEELKTKRASRRALLSLIDMDDLLDSGDRAIPSFMIAQFAVMGNVLYVSTYFRALEVERFLLINLTEIALLIRRIAREIGTITTVRFLLIAFEAHLTPDFHCLQKAELDRQSIERTGTIGVAVAKESIQRLLHWLHGKKQYESEILVDGLTEMLNAMKECPDIYPAALLAALSKAVQSLKEIKALRTSNSDESVINQVHAQYIGYIDRAMAELRRLDNAP